VDLIRARNYLEVAATAAGKRGRYRKFLNAIEKAQAESESRDVAIIAKAASDDWKAAVVGRNPPPLRLQPLLVSQRRIRGCASCLAR
jgi:hypothetical protein